MTVNIAQGEMTMNDSTETPASIDVEPDQSVTVDAEGVEDNHLRNREAAKYRTRLREVEAERDGIREELAAMTAAREAAERAHVENVAKRRLYRPSALWAAGVTLDEVRAEDGTISDDLVFEAVNRAADKLGLYRKMAPDFSQGAQGHGRVVGNAWEDAFSPR